MIPTPSSHIALLAPSGLLNTPPQTTSIGIQKLSSFLASSLMTVQNLEDILGNVNDPGSAVSPLLHTHRRLPERTHDTMCRLTQSSSSNQQHHHLLQKPKATKERQSCAIEQLNGQWKQYNSYKHTLRITYRHSGI